jgi:DNA adenine methylase
MQQNHEPKSAQKLTSPVSYYGGKKTMANIILPLIPVHRIYIEPFFGGGAIFFAKEKSQIEIINDLNHFVVNFYKVSKEKFDELQTAIQSTLHSRALAEDAKTIYQHQHLFSDLQKATAFYTLCNQNFAGALDSGWSYDMSKNNKTLSICRKRDSFIEAIQERIAVTQIENLDAIELIKRRDREDGFCFIDPPYVDANQGHYRGYTQANFDSLLEALSGIKGKFLLSSYRNDNLDAYAKRCGWEQIEVDLHCASSREGKRKIEVLTANYPLDIEKINNKNLKIIKKY